jgi:hypothetical protein
MLNLGDKNTKFFFNAMKSKKTDAARKGMPLSKKPIFISKEQENFFPFETKLDSAIIWV